MKSIFHLAAILVLCLIGLDLPARAQVATNCDTGCGGTPPTTGSGSIPSKTAANATRGAGGGFQASFAPIRRVGGGPVTIAGSQSFTYSVPLFSLPGRNGLDVNLTLYYNSFIWTVMGNSIVLNADHDNPSPGFRLDFGYIELSPDAGTGMLVDASGAKHLLIPNTTGTGYVTTDSTYVQMQLLSSATVMVATFKNGQVVTYNVASGSPTPVYRPAQFKDTNGNYFSILYQDNSSMRISQIIDTVGRKLNFAYDTNVSTQLNSITEVSAGNIALRSYNFTWTQNYPLYIAFTKSTGSLVNENGSNPSRINVLTAVTRPDGTSVAFGYADWGLVSQVSELSRAGLLRHSASYNWPIAGNGALSANPSYTQQIIFDGVHTGTWKYVAQTTAANIVTDFSVTDPSGTATEMTFSDAGNALDGVPLQRRVCSVSCTVGAGSVLRTTNFSWGLDASGINPRPNVETTILEDGVTQSQLKFQGYDAGGNLTDFLQYDFGSGGPGKLLRETSLVYAPLANNIPNKPTRIIVKDGTGNIVSRTDNRYDEGTVTDVNPNNVGHDPSYSSAFTARGNLTSMVSYANPASGTGGVTTSFTFDSQGNQVTSQQGSGPVTKKSFSASNWFSLPDSVSVLSTSAPPLALVSNAFTYNDDGQVLTSTDENGQKTTMSYDGAGRIVTTQAPDLSQTQVSYDDVDANPSSTNSTTANQLTAVQTTDGLHRVISMQILNGSTPVSTTTEVNDILGRPVQISNPSVAGGTAGFTTYVYDNLGRVTQVTPAAGSSGQRPYQTTYSANVLTLTDPAGQQRKQYVDALGRLVRLDEPGSLGGAAASGAVAISGTVLSVASNSSSNGATAGTASIALSAAAPCSTAITDRCNTQVVQQAAHTASVTVTIGGQNGTVQTCSSIPNRPPKCTVPVSDSGNITLQMNVAGTAVSSKATFDGSTNVTPQAVAQTLAQNLQGNSVVQAGYAAGSASLTLTTVATGNAMNASTLTASVNSNCVANENAGGNEVCGGAGWNVTTSGHFTGGLDQILTTKYDTGTITVGFTANGTSISEQIPYGQTDTPATLAQALLTTFSQDTKATALVNAGCTNGTCSDGLVKLTTVATGSGTNYPLTLSAITNSANFPSGSTSFTATSPSSSFVPGQPGTLYDSGTVTASLNGFTDGSAPQESVNYSQGSTAAGIAASLVAKINADPLWGAINATVPAGSATITFTARAIGVDANSYSVAISGSSNLPSTFPIASFPNGGSSSSVTGTLGGGAISTPSFDPSVVLTTSYSYDPLGRLLQVNQGQQSRVYKYDGLGRMLSSTIPETNNSPTNFTYTDFGAIFTRVDPRGVTSTYGYDSVGRLIDVKYSDGTPEVTFAFGLPGAAGNTGGRLMTTTDGTGSKSFQYDVMGRVTQSTQTVSAVAYKTAYSYNAAGELTSMTYPSGRVVTRKYDGIGQLSEVDNNGSAVYNVNSYNAAGQIVGTTYGNGMTGTYGYNNGLQLATIQYGSAKGSILDLSYDYGGANDNGHIQTITDNLVSARSTSYLYDELGRLQIAQTADQTSPNTWKLRFTYDRYGNRLGQTPVGGAGSMFLNEALVDGATNHLFGAGQSYDAAGNMTSDGVHSYTFDAEGRITSVDGPANSFAYDGSGFRARKNGAVYIGAGGQVVAEYAAGAAATSPNAEYLYAGHQRVAAITGGTTNYLYWDHQSVRSSADATGTITRTSGDFPYGETWYETLNPDKWKFTTYERDVDSEGGLDYANARFDSTRIGRFMSPDPLSGVMDNPQSLNRYAYALNDPINHDDPSGKAPNDPTNLCEVLENGGTGFCAGGPGGCTVDGQAAINCQEIIAGGFADVCSACGVQQDPKGNLHVILNSQDNGLNGMYYGWVVVITGETISHDGQPVDSDQNVSYQWGPYGQRTLQQAMDEAATMLNALPNGDQPVRMDIWHNRPGCEGCGDIWKERSDLFDELSPETFIDNEIHIHELIMLAVAEACGTKLDFNAGCYVAAAILVADAEPFIATTFLLVQYYSFWHRAIRGAGWGY